MFDRESGGEFWYALAVKPRHEKSAAAVLGHKGLEPFLPLYRERRRWSDRFKEVDLPLFPGYVFCRFGPRRQLAALTTPGVIRAVGAGNKPEPVSDGEIASLRAVMRSGAPAQPWPYLHAGDRVRIVAGPLEGLEGILIENSRQHRLVLSIALLQRAVAVEVAREHVAPATPALARAAAAQIH